MSRHVARKRFGQHFLADTGVIGAINCDGTQALGYFWSEVLGWPLVWDEDEETGELGRTELRGRPGVVDAPATREPAR